MMKNTKIIMLFINRKLIVQNCGDQSERVEICEY